jgi:hypothetical protein
MFEILEKRFLNDTVCEMQIKAPLVAKKAEPGQFIILRTDEDGERIPLTIAGFDRRKGTVKIIFQVVGSTTEILKHKNVGDDVYSANSYSFTHGREYTMVVSKKYLNEGDKILIIDDFMAGGNACNALIDIINQAHAEVVGIGIAIEKGFQPGGKQLREKGYNVRSLAIVDSMSDGKISFRSDDC